MINKTFTCSVIILTNFIVRLSSYKPDILNDIDSLTVQYATSCVQTILDCCFNYVNDYSRPSTHINQTLLLTVLISEDMGYPAEEIEQEIIKNVNFLIRWQLQIVDEVKHKLDQYVDCVKKCSHKKKILPVERYKSYFNIIISDSEENVYSKLDALSKLDSFHPKGMYLIFYTPKSCNSEMVANSIFEKLNDLNINKAFIMTYLPYSRSKIKIYRTSLDTENQVCGQFKLHPVALCSEGKLNESLTVYNISGVNDFHNCTMNVVSTKYEPYVIDHDEGFEVDVLQMIGQYFNINFQIRLNNESNDWGSKLNNTGYWDGNLGEIFNYSAIGVGNIGIDYEYIDDFDFSKSYLLADMIVVAPAAGFVPKWRVLTIIFTYEMWLIILGVLIVCGISIFLTAKYFNELPYFQPLYIGLITSFQLLLSQSLWKQPVSQQTRIVVLSLSIFSIIVSAIYTSYLIKVLTNPVREHQISTLEEIVSSGLSIGGMEADRDIFEDSDDLLSTTLLKNYKTYPNNTANKLLEEVSQNRNICVVLSKLYVNYLITKKSPIVVDKQGRMKIYVFRKKLYSYPVSIVVRKGFPLLPRFNLVISYMFRSGLNKKLAKNYVGSNKKLAEAKKDSSSGTMELTIYHVQGAFALFLIGNTISLAVFIIEHLTNKHRQWKHR